MTGKEIILYILHNNLEDKEIFENGLFVGFMSEEEAAVKFDVGIATIRTWHYLNQLKGTQLGDHLYFLKDVADPRIKTQIEMG